jgi:hypothetical protein
MNAFARALSIVEAYLPVQHQRRPEDDEFVDQRGAPRQQAALSAEIVLGGRSYAGQITNISNTGMTLGFDQNPSLFRGAQVLIKTGSLEPISGSVRWIGSGECGIAFNRAIAEDLLDNSTAFFDPGKRARPGRAKVKLPAVIRAPGLQRKVMIENIGCGGTLFTTGLSLNAGRGLMIEIDGILPIGGYVRWARLGRCGVMFSKMLPIAAAEEISERCSIHSSWLNEIRGAHAALAGR